MEVKLEIYVTDEENFKPYISPYNSNPLNRQYYKPDEEETEGEEEEEPQEEQEVEVLSNERVTDEGFYYHEGEIKETITYTAFTEFNWDKDYEDLSGSASIKLPYRNIDLKYLYQGVRCKLIADEYTYLGFITEVKYEENGISLSISSFSKLLEEKTMCEYNNKLRSVIIEEVIKEAGMEPVVDVTGLKDEFTSYTTITKTDSGKTGSALEGDDCQPTLSILASRGMVWNGHNGSGDNWDEEAKTGIANKDATYYDWARKLKTPRKVVAELRNMFSYSYYCDNRDNCASQTFETLRNGGGANCGDSARLLKACMDSIGTPCVCFLGQGMEGGHYWNAIRIDGEWKTIDLCYRSHIGTTPSTQDAGF